VRVLQTRFQGRGATGLATHRARVQHLGTDDGRTGDVLRQAAAHNLDLRKLRHRRLSRSGH